jgi:hypothetical protein
VMKVGQIVRSIAKHAVMRNYRPYEYILRHIRARGDIWMVSQGEYMAWWLKRENATLRVTVSDGVCRAYTSLENAVIERFPGEFLDSPSVLCQGTEFSGEVWLTVDNGLKRKELLIELLKREGILNFRIAREGRFFLSQAELGPLLEDIHTKLHQRGRFFEEDIAVVRRILIDRLAAHGLPLLRMWYHPRVDGVVIKAAFSPRYDVDRAIANLARIRALEEEYNVSSTLYIRAFGPFYGAKEIGALATMPWCSEIALHGEFVTNAHKYGDEFKAAVAEKEHLERLIGYPVLGVCMHGGELTSNTSESTRAVVQRAGFLYDTTSRMQYYFPFKRVVNGQLSKSYCLVHGFGDIKVAAHRKYGTVFCECAIGKMNEVYEQNGVFVLMLHPVYFGFWNYLLGPRNWGPIARFLSGRVRRLGPSRDSRRSDPIGGDL